MKKLFKERFHHITAVTNVVLFSMGIILLLVSISSDNYFIVSEEEKAEIRKKNEETLTDTQRSVDLADVPDQDDEERSPAGIRTSVADYRRSYQISNDDESLERNNLIGQRDTSPSQQGEDLGIPSHESNIIGSIKGDQQNIESVQSALLKNKFIRFKKIKDSIDEGTFFQENSDGNHTSIQAENDNNKFSE